MVTGLNRPTCGCTAKSVRRREPTEHAGAPEKRKAGHEGKYSWEGAAKPEN